MVNSDLHMINLFTTNYSEILNYTSALKERAFEYRDSMLVPLYDFGKTNAGWLNERLDFLIQIVTKIESPNSENINAILINIKGDVYILSIEVEAANKGNKDSKAKIPIYAGKIYANMLQVERYVKAFKESD